MAEVTILPATLDHARLLARSLRADDLRECLAVSSQPFKSLWRSWRGSPQLRKTAFVDGEIAAMWGCGGALLGYEGLPWLLTAPPIERIPLKFLRECRIGVSQMLELYPILRNYVHADYDRSIRFLELIGFTIGQPQPYGPLGALFRPVSLTRNQWAP